jgi:NADH:ubiquinone oxidoreductase subunit F (NADH-binding)
MLIEGMAIAALAVGATQGIAYIRAEYPDAVAVMAEAIKRATAAGWLGDPMHGSGHASLCAMGGMTPYPVLSALNHYPQDFGLAAPVNHAAADVADTTADTTTKTVA